MLQALRAISHNYPDLMLVCWGQISAIVYKFLRDGNAEVATKSWKEQAGNTALFVGEKIVTASIKVKLPTVFLFFFIYIYLCMRTCIYMYVCMFVAIFVTN